MSQSKEEELIRRLIENRAKLKGERLEALRRFRNIRARSRPLIQNEIERLGKKLGQNHPRVLDLRARLEHNLAANHGFAIEEQIERTEPPKVGKNDVMVMARVRDATLLGRKDYTLSVHDNEGKPITGLPNIKTDATGFGSFVIKDTVYKNLVKSKGPLTLNISDANGTIVDSRPLPETLEKREVHLAEIVVPLEERLVPGGRAKPTRTTPQKAEPSRKKAKKEAKRTKRAKKKDEPGDEGEVRKPTEEETGPGREPRAEEKKPETREPSKKKTKKTAKKSAKGLTTTKSAKKSKSKTSKKKITAKKKSSKKEPTKKKTAKKETRKGRPDRRPS